MFDNVCSKQITKIRVSRDAYIRSYVSTFASLLSLLAIVYLFAGIIPRAVAHLFHGMEKLQHEASEEGRMPPVFSVQAQFLELYNEQIRDLFDSARRGDGKGLHIHEDAYGSIYLKGATMKSMSSEEEVCLCMHAYVRIYNILKKYF